MDGYQALSVLLQSLNNEDVLSGDYDFMFDTCAAIRAEFNQRHAEAFDELMNDNREFLSDRRLPLSFESLADGLKNLMEFEKSY